MKIKVLLSLSVIAALLINACVPLQNPPQDNSSLEPFDVLPIFYQEGDYSSLGPDESFDYVLFVDKTDQQNILDTIKSDPELAGFVTVVLPTTFVSPLPVVDETVVVGVIVVFGTTVLVRSAIENKGKVISKLKRDAGSFSTKLKRGWIKIHWGRPSRKAQELVCLVDFGTSAMRGVFQYKVRIYPSTTKDMKFLCMDALPDAFRLFLEYEKQLTDRQLDILNEFIKEVAQIRY